MYKTSKVMTAIVALLLAMPGTVAAAPASPEAVVMKDSAAINGGDLEGLMAVLAPDLKVYSRPTEAHTLVGPQSQRIGDREQVRSFFKDVFAKPPLARHEVIDTVSLGEWVVARVVFQAPTDARADHGLTIFRVRNDLIDRIWHVAIEEDATPQSGDAAKATIGRLVEANNRGDVDAFLALFSPDARNFHFRHDPERPGGAPSRSVVDKQSRERVFREMFAKGAPAQVKTVDSLALGEWVVARDEAVRPDGTVLDELSIYRVRDGLIIDDWYMAEQPRP